LALRNRLPSPATAAELSSLAMVTRSVSTTRANKLWEQAQSLADSTPAGPILHGLRMDLAQASDLFVQATESGLVSLEADKLDKHPLETVSDVVVLESVKALVGKMFIKTSECYFPADRGLLDHLPAHRDSMTMMFEEDQEMSEFADYVTMIGKSSRGNVAEVLALWDKIWKGLSDDDVLEDLEATAEDDKCSLIRETKDLMKALVLLRSMLLGSSLDASTWSSSSSRSASMTPTSSSTCLSLSSIRPPSPAPTITSFSSSLSLKLRQALASAVFDEDEEIDEARDAVVDMLSNGRAKRSRFYS